MVGDEQRWIAVGSTRAGRILVVVFAVRNEAMRPNHGLDRRQRGNGLVLYGVGIGIVYGKSENEAGSDSQVFQRGKGSGMVGFSTA